MKFQVIAASPLWTLNGVNIFSSRLVRALVRRGIDAHVLLTRPWGRDIKPMPVPEDIPFRYLPAGAGDSAAVRRRRMIEYLEERAPCVYLPNNDYDLSCVSPCLSGGVKIAGIVHSDDPEHYEHVRRLGRHWDAVVAVSGQIRLKTGALRTGCPGPLVTIPYGVPVPDCVPLKSGTGPLSIVYAGRLVHYQKRVLDLAGIVSRLAARNVSFLLNIVGGGRDEGLLRRRMENFVSRGWVRFLGILPEEEVLKVFSASDVFLLPSEFEGMPIALLEAMGQGCVPVVSDIPSGIPELVREGQNGFLVTPKDADGFAEKLACLARHGGKRIEMAKAAYAAVKGSPYRIGFMAAGYERLFRAILADRRQSRPGHANAAVLPPPRLHPSWKKRIPDLARAFLSAPGNNRGAGGVFNPQRLDEKSRGG